MAEETDAAAPVRSFWSGTITFGLVSIPVDFFAAARPRQKSMKMVDAQGHPLGRRYTREDDEKPLANDEIVRGYETEEGRMVVVSDEEFESAAPENSRDIELSRFVPLEQIPPAHFVRPYFLAPTTRAGKAYSLLAQTMERTGLVGIGRLVMRGHEYLLAIIASGGALRAETLRYHDELRTPETVGLPAPAAPPAKLVKQFAGEIGRLREDRLDLHELEDRESDALHRLAEEKRSKGQDVVDLSGAEDEEAQEGTAEIVDLVQLLRRSLGGDARASGTASTTAPPARARTGAPKAAPSPAPAPAQARALAEKTREELYAMAADLDLPGRSKMKKAELVRALAAADVRAAA